MLFFNFNEYDNNINYKMRTSCNKMFVIDIL